MFYNDQSIFIKAYQAIIAKYVSNRMLVCPCFRYKGFFRALYLRTVLNTYFDGLIWFIMLLMYYFQENTNE